MMTSRLSNCTARSGPERGLHSRTRSGMPGPRAPQEVKSANANPWAGILFPMTSHIRGPVVERMVKTTFCRCHAPSVGGGEEPFVDMVTMMMTSQIANRTCRNGPKRCWHFWTHSVMPGFQAPEEGK